MMSKVWKNTKNTKVWNRCTRYEKCAQGMKNVLKVYNSYTEVWNAFLRYETRVFLKNSGFSYLYGSVSYLFGYENIGCFSLMADHRRLVSRPRATHIPACMLAPPPASASGVSPLASIVFESTVCTLAPSPAGGGLRLGRKRLGPRLHVDRFRILNLPAQFFRGFEGFEGVSY